MCCVMKPELTDLSLKVLKIHFTNESCGVLKPISLMLCMSIVIAASILALIYYIFCVRCLLVKNFVAL